jgi:hypothetical protein
MEPQTKPEVRMNEVTYSHTFIPEVITVFPPPLLGKSLTCRIPLRDSTQGIPLAHQWLKGPK